MKNLKLIKYGALVSTLFVGFLMLPSISAQNLEAELDALEDLPEDDLSGWGSPSGGSGDMSSGFDSIPDASDFDLSTSSLPSSNVPPPAGASLERRLRVGDLDLQGLEQELNFDSFKDGSKISLDQLQTGQDVSDSGITGRITSVDFKQMADRVRLVVGADRPVEWTRELRAQRRQVIVELRNMVFAKEILKRALDTGEFEGPVALIKAYPSKIGNRESVNILFQLRSFVDPTILRTGNEIVIDFPIVSGESLFKNRTQAQAIVPKTYLSPNDIREFKGGPISLNVKNAELGDILNLISRSSGKNFILNGDVGSDKKITVNFTNVPWDQALSLVLFNNGLGYQDLESVYRVATVEALKKELNDAVEANNQKKNLVPLETRLIPVNYAKGEEILPNVTPFLTKDRGTVTVDKRSNTLVITDMPDVLEKVDRYVRSVDKQTPQILVEARIVEAKENFSRDRNFAWGLGGELRENGTGGRLNVGQSPAPDALTGAENSVFRFGTMAGPIGLIDAFLRMSEKETLTRTIASPRITMLANEPANVTQGVKRQVIIPNEAGNAVTSYVDINTELIVTPQVTSDGFVILEIDLKRDILENNDTGAVGSRSAKTKMIVESGRTAVIGGMYTSDKIDTESGFPFLRKIPIFGSLFKNSVNKQQDTNELLMFISPRIINSDRSQIVGGSNFGQGDFSATAVGEPAAR